MNWCFVFQMILHLFLVRPIRTRWILKYSNRSKQQLRVQHCVGNLIIFPVKGLIIVHPHKPVHWVQLIRMPPGQLRAKPATIIPVSSYAVLECKISMLRELLNNTNCAPLIADIFRYSYETEFIQSLLSAVKEQHLSSTSHIYIHRWLIVHWWSRPWELSRSDVYH